MNTSRPDPPAGVYLQIYRGAIRGRRSVARGRQRRLDGGRPMIAPALPRPAVVVTIYDDTGARRSSPILDRLQAQRPNRLNEALFGCLRCDLVLPAARAESGCRWGEPHNLTPLVDAVAQRAPKGTP